MRTSGHSLVSWSFWSFLLICLEHMCAHLIKLSGHTYIWWKSISSRRKFSLHSSHCSIAWLHFVKWADISSSETYSTLQIGHSTFLFEHAFTWWFTKSSYLISVPYAEQFVLAHLTFCSFMTDIKRLPNSLKSHFCLQFGQLVSSFFVCSWTRQSEQKTPFWHPDAQILGSYSVFKQILHVKFLKGSPFLPTAWFTMSFLSSSETFSFWPTKVK